MATPVPLIRRAVLLAQSRRTLKRHIATSGGPPANHTPIEEERVPGYNPKHFLPVNPGDVLNNRYKILVKLGWATTSTVWLAQDPRRWWRNSTRYVTVKVTTSNVADYDTARHERILTQHVQKNPSHDGFPFVGTMLDSFEIQGQEGPHLCLVYEPMREPLGLYIRRWENSVLPPALAKVYATFVLRGLEYLHSECQVIHTDLKLDNILLGFENATVLEDFVKQHAHAQLPQKVVGGRSIYSSQYDFGPPRSFGMLPKIADFGLAQSGEGSQPLMHPIQPHVFHAPEVLLNTSWSYSADIWNLGLMIFEMMEGRDLFTKITTDGQYDARAHLAEMCSLLGPPPKVLVHREQQWRNVKWSHAVPNPKGVLSQSASEYYGGPFFDPEGQFMHKHLVSSAIKLEDTISCLEGDEKDVLVDFLKQMLQWLPEERPTARQLLTHPWLTAKSP